MTLQRVEPTVETRVPQRESGILAAFAYRDFRLLWFGLLVSNLGTWIQLTTLGYTVAKLAATPALASLYVGILGASAAVPVVLTSPLAGVVADRFPRRRVLLITNSTTIVLAFTLAILASLHRLEIWEIFVLEGLRSTTQGFDAPARQSWVPLLVPREKVGTAIGLNSIAFNAPAVIGPPIAGLLILYVGISWSFYINAFATFAVVAALVLMRPSPASSTSREGVLSAIAAGLKFLWGQPVLRSVVLTLAVVCLFVRPYAQLLPAYAVHLLHVDARGLGTLMAATGVGAIVGSVVTSIVGSRRRGTLWFASCCTMALCTIALGRVHDFAFAVATLAVLGLATLSFVGSSNVLLQTLSPDDMRGRSISVFSMIVLGVVPAGSLVLGTLATVIGLGNAISAGGAVALALVVLEFAHNGALRRV